MRSSQLETGRGTAAAAGHLTWRRQRCHSAAFGAIERPYQLTETYVGVQDGLTVCPRLLYIERARMSLAVEVAPARVLLSAASGAKPRFDHIDGSLEYVMEKEGLNGT